jgi:hypothetical protein
MTGALNVPAAATGTEVPQVQEVLTLASGGTVAADVTATNLVSNGDVQTTSLNGGPLAGFRNLFVNGIFSINQRFGSTPQTLAGSQVYFADRWKVTGTTTTGGTPTWQTTNGGTNTYRLRLVTATNIQPARIEQIVEAANVRPLAGQQMTVSVYANEAPSVFIYTYDSSNTQVNITASPQSMVSEGGNRYSFTFTLPTAQIATQNLDPGLGVQFRINGNSNPVPAGTYEFWRPQLEPGPVATPFEHRPIGAELALCQRYYQKFDDRVVAAMTLPNTTATRWFSSARTVSMRATPDETFTVNSGTPGTSSSSASSIAFTIGGVSDGAQCFITNYAADAEL